MSCVKLLLVLTSIGIITGIIVSLYSSHIILSYSASINSGNLLYIGTMKLIVKNYDTSGNKYIYFFAFFLGFVIMSAGIYEDVFSWPEKEKEEEDEKFYPKKCILIIICIYLLKLNL